MRLLPREEKFYGLFQQQVEIIAQAAKLLLEGAKAGNSSLAKASEEVRVLEAKGDEIIHEILTRLNQTFITPLDPEDIHQISSGLDDVLDGIEDAAYAMVAYKLEPIPPPVLALCQIVYECSGALRLAFQALEKDDPILAHCIEINRLEDSADTILRTAISDLFAHETNPINLIKSKEVFEFLEATTDRCEDVADTLQAVVVKNS